MNQYCGIDLAVKRKTYVALLLKKQEGIEVHVFPKNNDEEIIEYCEGSEVVAIDSPLSYTKGFREVDKEMIRRGYKVLPPSWMNSLVERALNLSKAFNKVIETHPTSSAKNLGLNWKDYSKVKDEFDALLCSLVAYLYDRKEAMEIKAVDGRIYLVPKGYSVKIMRVNDSTFKLL
ncbi:MAG: DUF429 domain-containing protein [Sulfolobaceae archaeon]|nr:DUF429 domain-containing protein [Sulfolobaceae archaeon]